MLRSLDSPINELTGLFSTRLRPRAKILTSEFYADDLRRLALCPGQVVQRVFS